MRATAGGRPRRPRSVAAPERSSRLTTIVPSSRDHAREQRAADRLGLRGTAASDRHRGVLVVELEPARVLPARNRSRQRRPKRCQASAGLGLGCRQPLVVDVVGMAQARRGRRPRSACRSRAPSRPPRSGRPCAAPRSRSLVPDGRVDRERVALAWRPPGAARQQSLEVPPAIVRRPDLHVAKPGAAGGASPRGTPLTWLKLSTSRAAPRAPARRRPRRPRRSAPACRPRSARARG